MSLLKVIFLIFLFLSSALSGKSPQIMDPIQHLYTLNSHGAFADDKFELPENVYVLIPHTKGLEIPYVLNLPPEKSLEERIYTTTPQAFPMPTTGGWRVYKPGDSVRNLKFSPWNYSKDNTAEYNDWSKKVPKEDLNYVKKDKNGKIPNFALVPARNSTLLHLSYKQKQKFKYKVFGNTNLKTVVNDLHQKFPNETIVLIPLTCNAGKNNIQVSFRNTHVDILPLFK